MESEEIIESLDKSQNYIIIIFFAIALAYSNINLQKKLILCPNEDEEYILNDRKIFSNVMILTALLFFYRLSKNLSGECSLDFYASALTLLAGLLRYVDITKINC